MKRIIAWAFALTALFGLTGCYTQIDTGNVGVLTVAGQVKPEPLKPDWYFRALGNVTEVCAKEVLLQLDNMRPQTSDKITLTDLDIDIYVQINPSMAPAIMTKWPGDLDSVKGEDCARIGMNYVTRQAREAVYDIATKFGSQTIHTERAAISAGVVQQLQASLEAGGTKGMFLVSSANVRALVTDPALEKNIKDAAAAQFALQKQKNELEVAKIEAEKLRVQAQGEADAIRIKAESVSKQGGAEYVQLQAIAKWDGKLPVTNAGGAVPFLNVK